MLGGKVPVAGRGARWCSSSVGFVSDGMELQCPLQTVPPLGGRKPALAFSLEHPQSTLKY